MTNTKTDKLVANHTEEKEIKALEEEWNSDLKQAKNTYIKRKKKCNE